jgi:hypothetical protein
MKQNRGACRDVSSDDVAASSGDYGRKRGEGVGESVDEIGICW